ncbi:DnaD domain-containing protein [Alteribacillus sp. HJP-4]|uniref:DnaD domain-containing protein n=1 Tax=Alteribacillus sp. HJP-4 TaxID=2775394 RepID=UPI0035CD3897
MNRLNIATALQTGHVSLPKLLLDNYVKIGLDEIELMMLMHIQRFIDEQHPFPTPSELSQQMSLTEKQCAGKLRSLIKNGFLQMQEAQDEDHLFYETYSLLPLYERLTEELFSEKLTQQPSGNDEGQLFEIFEEEFSRPLSPMECETIKVWIDQDKYKTELIRQALRECVLSGKLNLRYMDRVLHEWTKNGIRTAADAKVYGEKFRKQQSKRYNQKEKEKGPAYPNINWLDES